jgi:hypothetical protein
VKNHRIEKHDIGKTYYITEPRGKNNLHPVAMFENKEDRDMIFDAMKLGGYCGHSTKSWIRSIPPVKNNEKGLWR